MRRREQLISFPARTLVRPRGVRAQVFAGVVDGTLVHVPTGAFVRLEFVARRTHALVAAVVVDAAVLAAAVVARALVHICKEVVDARSSSFSQLENELYFPNDNGYISIIGEEYDLWRFPARTETGAVVGVQQEALGARTSNSRRGVVAAALAPAVVDGTGR